MKTIAQQLGIKEFPFEIKDKNGNEIYREDSDGYWNKKEYDSERREIYFENSGGYWWKCEYDSDGNAIYCEDDSGVLIDKRPKDDVITIEGIKYKRIDE